MARTLILLANVVDYEALIEAFSSLGLHLVPMQPGSEIDSPSERPVCFLSYLPQSDLHPIQGEKPRFVEVIDPLLFFARPHQEGLFLVDGQIRLNEDNKEVVQKIKPYFSKIEQWLKSNWLREKILARTSDLLHKIYLRHLRLPSNPASQESKLSTCRFHAANISVKVAPYGRWTSRKRAALYLKRYGSCREIR